MADYWIKLYIEILDDPKMGTLPDRLWRRVIELFLLAGRINGCEKTGRLPDTRQLAWALRLPIDELELDLQQIAAAGIITREVNGWLVINFAKRQEAVSSTERVRQHRERKQRNQYYGGVTETKRNVTQSRTETDTDIETEEEVASPTSIPNEQTAEKIYQAVSKTVTFPAQKRGDCINAILSIMSVRSLDINQTIEYLQPFFNAWRERNYGPSNPAWLTEWAVSGDIPTKKNGKARTGRVLTGAHGEQIEVDE